MEGTGMSLFHGADSIHVNNNEQDQLDEIEELEDQKRRKEELQNNLKNAFTDLDDSFGNSTGNYTMAPHTSNSIGHQEQQMYTPHGRGFSTSKQYHTPHTLTNSCPNTAGAGDGHNFMHPDYQVPINGVNCNLVDSRNHSPVMIGRDHFVHNLEMQFKKQMNEALEKQDKEIEVLQARLSAAVIEREKAELSLQQTQQALASSKHSIQELEQRVSKKDDQLNKADCDIQQLHLELQAAANTLNIAQQKLQSQAISQSHNTDALFREQQERYKEEIDRLHEDLQKTKQRLEEKDKEATLYERRWKDSEKEKESLQDKAIKLKAAQEQIKLYTAKLNSVSKDYVECQKAVVSQNTTAKLNSVSKDYVECQKHLTLLKTEYDDWRTTLQKILNDSLPVSYIGSPGNSAGKLSILEDILSRYKQRIKQLEEELADKEKKLESTRKQASEAQSKIEEYKGEELQLKSKVAMLENKLNLLDTDNDGQMIETYRTQNAQIQTKLDEISAKHKELELKHAELEIENNKLRTERSDRMNKQQSVNAELLNELQKYSTTLKEKFKENAELKTLYFGVCCAREAKDRELKEIELKLKTLQKEKENYTSKELELQDLLDKERQMVTKLNTDLAVKREELSTANGRISELQRECTEKQKEFTDKLNQYIEEERKSVRTELEICSQCEQFVNRINSLEEELNQLHIQVETQESNNELMQQLRNNAEYFQNYILEIFQKQQRTTVGTNTEEPTSVVEQPIAVNGKENEEEINGHTEEDAFTARTNLMLKEKEIRDQIAEKYTLEIKTVEMKWSKRLKELENEHICNINKLKQLLERKVGEVETLKQFILSERSKITEILNAKESEISMLIKENNSMQEEFQQFREKVTESQNILEKSQAKISKLKIEYEKKCLELGCEKEKWSRSRNEIMQKIQVLEAKNAQLDAEHSLLKEKYKSIKKTALTYKEYAAKKDEHVESELDRIKSHYKDIITELQSKIQQLVNRRQQAEVPEKLNKLQFNGVPDSARQL